MYNSRPGLLIGFHGCDESTRNLLLNSPNTVKKSEKPYDWLGHGMYFWENNEERALQWAKGKKSRGEIDIPSVLMPQIQSLSPSRLISKTYSISN